MLQNQKLQTKQYYQNKPKSNNQNSQDWVCIKCNNLNFSFRKKCNRCKVQSREDNHQIIYADYYYYNQYYQYQTPQQELKTIAQGSSLNTFTQPKSPQKKIIERNSDDEIENRQLPSVSPLIKKYNKSQQKIISQEIKNQNKNENTWKLFGEYIWNTEQFSYIDLKMAQRQLESTDDEHASEQFIKSVQKMII